VKVAGAISNNTRYGIQIDTSGATTNGGVNAVNQQVTVREGYVSYTTGDGETAKNVTFTGGQFANPFGYELFSSTANILSPERPIAFNENGYGIWAYEDYVLGVQAAYNTQSQLLFLPAGIKLSYSAVNPNGRSTDNQTRHVDSIYRVSYQTPNKILGLGASYYDGEVSTGTSTAASPIFPTAIAAQPAGTNQYREPKKQLFGVDGRLLRQRGVRAGDLRDPFLLLCQRARDTGPSIR
jgi:hypothetical protein